MPAKIKHGVIFLDICDGGKHSGDLVIGMPKLYQDRLEQLVGLKYTPGRDEFTMPRTWTSFLSLRELARSIKWRIEPSPEVKAWAEQMNASWKSMRALSATVRRREHKEGQWFAHQEDGAAWLNAGADIGVGRLLLDDTGTGKTVTIIKALIDSGDPGPILITCPENVMDTGWANAFARFAPHYRTLQITGSVVQRRKALAEVKDGLWDVVIIGHTNLRSHTRFRAYPGIALKRCVQCGGPKLTTGKVDGKGKSLPDIDYHREVELRLISSPVDLDTGIPGDEPPEYRAVCKHNGCVWVSAGSPRVADSVKEAMGHARTGKKVTEVTEAQCQAHTKELNEIAWTTMVVDEAHRGTNPQSQTAAAFWGVAKYGPGGRSIPNHRRWPATGTPISKRTDQAWALLHLIGPEHWPVKTDWVDYNCTMKHNFGSGNMEVAGLKPERESEFQATFAAVTRRVLKDQVLDLPPLLRWGSLERRLRMTGAQLKAYTSMREEMLLLVEEGLITADNAAQQAGRLSALATGTGYPHPGNVPGGPRKMLLRPPSIKLDAVIEDLRSGEFDGHQIGMMFASFQALQMFRDALIEHKVIRKDDVSTIAGPMPKEELDLAIKKFQNGDRRFVMFTYAKGAEGITLTAADVVLAVERSWNTIHNLQGVNRFHRIGSERHDRVTVIDYVVGNSNEIRQLERLEENAATIEQVVQDRNRLRGMFA